MSTSPILSPTRLGPLTLRNRIVKCATYETCAEGGLVTDALVEWHREVAAGGVAMTTLAYCAVAADGRTFKDQIVMRPEAAAGLARFAAAMHAEGAKAALQLGHAGWFADPKATGTRPLGPSRTFSLHAQTFARALTAADLDRLERDFAAAARLAVEAGFDALEVHVGHGYLLSQFLSPYNNRRRDEWGGSLENRARFPRRIVRAVREAAGRDVAIWAKLNMEDGFANGLSLDDGLEVARMLEADGALDALQLTGGHTTKTPMFLMRGDSPIDALFARERNPFRRVALRFGAKLVMRNYRFEEAFFAPLARRFRAAVRMPLMLLGGVNQQATMEAALGEGFDLLALGRALIRQPDLVRRIEAGDFDGTLCTHCNQCVAYVGHAPTTCPLR
ncbi:MAG: NADH:flavin oxidoreductase [Deltaproteobacteria bacterium]|nr:NADH:flavin oxidoreductase [Deltaproteobacteria bacterium]